VAPGSHLGFNTQKAFTVARSLVRTEVISWTTAAEETGHCIDTGVLTRRRVKHSAFVDV